jgi:hypothetical protein
VGKGRELRRIVIRVLDVTTNTQQNVVCDLGCEIISCLPQSTTADKLPVRLAYLPVRGLAGGVPLAFTIEAVEEAGSGMHATFKHGTSSSKSAVPVRRAALARTLARACALCSCTVSAVIVAYGAGAALRTTAAEDTSPMSRARTAAVCLRCCGANLLSPTGAHFEALRAVVGRKAIAAVCTRRRRCIASR